MEDEPDLGLMEELEYEGLGGDEEQGQISGYVQGLAQEVSQQLECWMEDGALTDGMLEPMIELLKQVFVDFEHYYVQSLQVDQLTEEKETLQQSLYTMKQKYQSTVERHNTYVDQLEQENREEKSSAHELREKNADLTSRLMTAKSSLEELQVAYEQAKAKHKEEFRKLYNAVEFYRSSSERREQTMSLRRSVRSSSVQVKAVEVAHSLAITSSGIPLIPDADRGFSPDPGSHVEEIALLATSEHSSVSHQSGAAEEQPTSNVSLQKELDTIQKPHDDTVSGQSVSSLVERASSFEENQRTGENDEVLDENEISEGDQEMLPESDQLKEQTENSENLTYSWMEVENTAGEATPRVAPPGKRAPALSLAQEFELLAPEEFAQTEMQQILEQRDEAVQEKEKLELDKQKILTDLEAFRNQNIELKKIIEECKAKEEALSGELASARRDHEKALQELFPDEDLGNAFAFTKKEMFIKIKELMQLKKRCHFLEEDNRNLQKLLNEKKTPKQKSLLSAILDKVFGRNRSTPRHDIHMKEQKTPVKTTVLKRSTTPTILSVKLLQGVSLEDYTLCNNWLVGYRAAGVISSLPDYIGRILLKGLEISRIDYCAVARISKGSFTPDSSLSSNSSISTSPVNRRSKSFIAAGPNSHGQCIAEIWVATSFESVSHIEVISIFSPTEKQVQKLFMTKCQHVQCMMAVPGCVPVSEEYRRCSRSSLSPPPVTELSLVSDNKDPLRKGSVSPEGRKDEELMWIISDTNKLYFHGISKDCHREINVVDLERKSFCIEYAGDRVFIGQSNGNLMIFSKSKDDKYLWDIQKPFVVGISCPPPEQEININYIKNIRKKLWIALGQAIYIMDPQQLGIEIIVDESKDGELGTFIHCIEEVQDLAVISFYRRPIIKIYDSTGGNYIKKIDISSPCIILDKLPASPTVGSGIPIITTLSSNDGILYVGTRCGKLFAFSAKTLSGDINEDSGGEDSPDGRKKRKKLKKLAEAAEKEKEEAKMDYEKQLAEDINSCAISVYMHKFSTRKILCMSLPIPSQPNVPVVYNSLAVTIGKGHYHHSTKSSNELARSSSPSDRLSDHCQLLVWGCQKEDESTIVS